MKRPDDTDPKRRSDQLSAVFGFADRVADSYAGCSPKQPAADDAVGFAKFLAEWERRLGQQASRTRRCT
jgi:hypothetical protein